AKSVNARLFGTDTPREADPRSVQIHGQIYFSRDTDGIVLPLALTARQARPQPEVHENDWLPRFCLLRSQQKSQLGWKALQTRVESTPEHSAGRNLLRENVTRAFP